MTTTYESTSSNGKLNVEHEWLIPLLKQSVNISGNWMGVIGAADGINRHIENAKYCGFDADKQFYFEHDVAQYNDVSTYVPPDISYELADLIDAVRNNLDTHTKMSIVDADFCKLSDGHLQLLYYATTYKDLIGITIHCMTSYTSDKCNDEMWLSYGIDTNQYDRYSDRIIQLYQNECSRAGLICHHKRYQGKGGSVDKHGGSPMLLIVTINPSFI